MTIRRFGNLVLFTAFCILLGPAGAEQWRDGSPHRVLFAPVDEQVILEVLDWGGTGRPLVLLAGLGHTAHVFDNLGPKLIDSFHVYAITRRGFGSSTHATLGYEQSRLVEDVIAVLDYLRLTGVVLAGHSFAGQELTSVAIRDPDRIEGLIYLDAAADDLRGLEDSPELKAIIRQLPQPDPSISDLSSFSNLQAWWTRTYGVTPPEAELRSMYAVSPTGGVGRTRAANEAWKAAMAGVGKPDYRRLRMPILAIYAVPRSAGDLPPWLRTDDKVRLRAIDEAYIYGVAARERAFKAIRWAPNSRIVKLQGADHYLFLSNMNEIVREIRAFASTLP